jgi:vacuolar protein sorting-associated protein 3
VNRRTADGISEGSEAGNSCRGWESGFSPPFLVLLFVDLACVQLGNHRSALSILVHDLRDFASAEAYSILGGDVAPGKIAPAIGDKYALQLWSSALFPLPASAAVSRTVSTATSKGSTLPMPVLMGRQKSGVYEGVKKALLNVPLEVYMNDGYISV